MKYINFRLITVGSFLIFKMMVQVFQDPGMDLKATIFSRILIIPGSVILSLKLEEYIKDNFHDNKKTRSFLGTGFII